MSVLIWILTALPSDSVPERNFIEVNFENSQQTTVKNDMKNYPACKELNNFIAYSAFYSVKNVHFDISYKNINRICTFMRHLIYGS